MGILGKKRHHLISVEGKPRSCLRNIGVGRQKRRFCRQDLFYIDFYGAGMKVSRWPPRRLAL
jgi:hypothetical protein